MRIIVLNDGETYSDLDGVAWYHVPDTYTPEDIEDALQRGDEDSPDLKLIGWFNHVGAIHIA